MFNSARPREVSIRYLVGDRVEYVRHIAQVRYREYWIKQLPLPTMLCSPSRQYPGSKEKDERAVLECQSSHGDVKMDDTNFAGPSPFCRNSCSLTSIACKAFGSWIITKRRYISLLVSLLTGRLLPVE